MIIKTIKPNYFRRWLIAANAAWIAVFLLLCSHNNISAPGYVFTELGTTLRGVGLSRLAIASYSAALHFVPNAPRVHGARAYAYLMAGDYGAALTGYNRALEIEGPNAYRFETRAGVYVELRRYEYAVADYQAALALDPENVQLHRALVACYYRLKRYDALAAEYKIILDREPASAQDEHFFKLASAMTRGEAALKQADYDTAIKEFSGILSVRNHRTDHEVAGAKLSLAICLKMRKPDCKAQVEADRKRTFEEAAKSGFATKNFTLAQSFVLMDQLRQSVEREYQIGAALVEQRRYSESISHLNAATESAAPEPNSEKYFALRARVFSIIGRNDDALSDLAAAKRLATKPTMLQKYLEWDKTRGAAEAEAGQ